MANNRLTSRLVALALGLILAIPFGAFADRFPLFGSAEGILVGCVGSGNCWQTTSATGANVIDLWGGTCDATTFLRGDGTCAAAGGGGGDVYLANTNVFTNAGSSVLAPITLSSAGPKLFWNATGAAADQRLWRDYVQGTTRLFDVASDAGSQQFTWGELTRSATGIDQMAWSAEGAISLNAPLVAASGDMDVTGALTVGSCTGCSTPIAPAALTRVDDTNVTLTLGGSPSTALVNAASITAGWTGQLGVARGGSGAATLTGLLQGNGTGAFTGITNSSTVGQVLRTTGAATYGWGALDLADSDAITGDLPDANLSANVPLLNVANAFTNVGITSFNGGVTAAGVFSSTNTGASRFGTVEVGAGGGAVVPVNNSPGIYEPSNNRLGFATAGLYRGEFDASGNFLVSGGNYMLTSTTPRFIYNESDATTDEKIWHEQVDTKVYTLGTRNDADSAGLTAISITRGTGTAISNLTLGNTSSNPTFTLSGTGGFSTGGNVSANGTITGFRVLVNASTIPASGTPGIYEPANNILGFATSGVRVGSFDTAGNFAVEIAGTGLQVKEGSNAKQGVATLVGGTVTVANTAVTANSRIFLTPQTLGTVVLPSACGVSARVASTSFTILCDQPTDTSVMAYEIFEPTP